MFVADLLQGKRILVTGGGTGLGKSMARRFAELGAAPILCGRRKQVLDDAATEIADATGARVTTHSWTCATRPPWTRRWNASGRTGRFMRW